MSKYLPADYAGMMTAIFSWANGQIAAGGALVAFAAAPYTVIWGEQDAPPPAHPYAVLRTTMPPHTIGGDPTFETVSGQDVARIEYDSEFVIQIELLTRAPLDPVSGLNELSRLTTGLEASLRSHAQLELFDTAGMAFLKSTPPFFIPVIEGFGYERRARIEMHFRARTRLDVATPALTDPPPVHGIVLNPDGSFSGTIGG